MCRDIINIFTTKKKTVRLDGLFYIPDNVKSYKSASASVSGTIFDQSRCIG